MTPLELLALLQVPAQPATFEEYLSGWEKVRKLAKSLSEIEMTMRKAIFASAFPNPVEGANTFVLSDGRKLKAQHKISRTIDETQVALARSEYELLNDRPVIFDELLKVKFDLVISGYRKLTPSSPAFLAVSRMINAKPGAPTIDIA